MAKAEYNLQVIQLNSWCKRIKMLIKAFHLTSFMHISVNFNREAGKLSKLVVNNMFGTLYFQEVLEGRVVQEGSTKLI